MCGDIKDPILGYANTTCLAIITHLRDTYGEISQEDLDANELRMGAAWNPLIPIKDLFEEQLRAGAAFVATEGGDAPSKPAMVHLGYNLILKTGLFTDGCRDWRKKPQADRTMATFKKHFKMWEKDRYLMLTTGTACFHGANHVEPPAPVAPPVPQHQSTQNLRNCGPNFRPSGSPWQHKLWPQPHHHRPQDVQQPTLRLLKWDTAGHMDTVETWHTPVSAASIGRKGISKMPPMPIGWQARNGSGREPIVALPARKEGR
eukprot:scaffold154321_cov49-Attheya_sp.AAC.3